ncbi:MAG TPA: DUF6766 family protein [Candidatus Paceibacterota bacterium]|nr:DUF6766 family protein [Candidatus Paceibacterota bacterium]
MNLRATDSIWKKYGYLWATLILFIGSVIGHWTFGWFAYVDEQLAHGAQIEANGYLIEMLRDTLENWQSEFLQLMWQVGGLAFLFYLGSPQSKEGDDRIEEKLDLILKSVAKDGGEEIKRLDKKYARV